MRILLMIACLITLLSTNKASAPASTAIPFKMVNGLILFEASVDQYTGYFILDTGADHVIINEAYGSGEKTIFETIGGSLEAYETELHFLQITKDYVRELDEAYLAPLLSLEATLGTKISGIIGSRVFTPHSLEINYHDEELLIYQQGLTADQLKGMQSLDFNFTHGVPLIKIKSHSKHLNFIMDSGASKHFIDVDYLLSSPFEYSVLESTANIATAHSTLKSSTMVLLKGFNFGSYSKGTPFITADMKLLSDALGENVHGLISLRSLSKDRIILDLQSRKIYF